MADYINRDSVIELSREYYSQGLKEKAVPVTAIKNIPSADVAEVVRCKDCKNNGTQICSVCCSYQGCPDRWEAKPKTNADRIRAMSDEELAREFTRLDMFCCPVSGVTCAYEPKCQDCFKRWLKKEADT